MLITSDSNDESNWNVFFINFSNICQATQVAGSERGIHVLFVFLRLKYMDPYNFGFVPANFEDTNWTVSSIALLTRLRRLKQQFSKSLVAPHLVFLVLLVLKDYDCTALNINWSCQLVRRRVGLLRRRGRWVTAPRYRKVIACFLFTLFVWFVWWGPINQCCDAWHDLLSVRGRV